MKCQAPGCPKAARQRTTNRGKEPTFCDEHSDVGTRRKALRTVATATIGGASNVTVGGGPVSATALLPLGAPLAPSALPSRQKQALASALRDVQRSTARALALLTTTPGPWDCPACGPLVDEPLHGADERMHCPNDGCDEVVSVAGLAPAPGEPGAAKGLPSGSAYRGTKAGTVVARREG
jgi:hypothetical protein